MKRLVLALAASAIMLSAHQLRRSEYAWLISTTFFSPIFARL